MIKRCLQAKFFYSLWMGAWKGVQIRGWTDGHGDGGRQGAGDGEQRCLVHNILG